MDLFHAIINAIGLFLNIIGSVIIIYGAVLSIFDFIKKEIISREEPFKMTEKIRGELGGYLVLGLEFFIAGDVIKTIITPTWQSLGMLGAIVVIRTILSYFLVRDLKKA